MMPRHRNQSLTREQVQSKAIGDGASVLDETTYVNADQRQAFGLHRMCPPTRTVPLMPTRPDRGMQPGCLRGPPHLVLGILVRMVTKSNGGHAAFGHHPIYTLRTSRPRM